MIFWQTCQPPHNVVIMSLQYCICFTLWKEYRYIVINSYLGVIMLWWVHEPSNIGHALLWFSDKPGGLLTIQLQWPCHIVFALHFQKNIVPNSWHQYNPTCHRYMVINCYLGVIILWQVHERHNAKSDFPKFPDEHDIRKNLNCIFCIFLHKWAKLS